MGANWASVKWFTQWITPSLGRFAGPLDAKTGVTRTRDNTQLSRTGCPGDIRPCIRLPSAVALLIDSIRPRFRLVIVTVPGDYTDRLVELWGRFSSETFRAQIWPSIRRDCSNSATSQAASGFRNAYPRYCVVRRSIVLTLGRIAESGGFTCSVPKTKLHCRISAILG